MAKDWIKFDLGKAWYGGIIHVRIAMIQAVTKNPSEEGESLVYLMVDNAIEVLGTPEEIMEMIDARTSS